ncbi:hypothetical protein N657DRAFT_678594 [Parathielavia appendiculata]|uniref:Heterokaryon incompatibility domain-containing protein n=1 Tax=Parathielavia appendiculata TaxID=2587402 RepID=A0AAN6U2W8_9PEZI|nr:hypothetical protein N657DRAFT_678594 [Parathielavia appendiculata]
MPATLPRLGPLPLSASGIQFSSDLLSSLSSGVFRACSITTQNDLGDGGPQAAHEAADDLHKTVSQAVGFFCTWLAFGPARTVAHWILVFFLGLWAGQFIVIGFGLAVAWLEKRTPSWAMVAAVRTGQRTAQSLMVLGPHIHKEYDPVRVRQYLVSGSYLAWLHLVLVSAERMGERWEATYPPRQWEAAVQEAYEYEKLDYTRRQIRLLRIPRQRLFCGHLRCTLVTGLVWVDAICVNQSDAEEKSQQLPLMQDIYSKAKKVVVWPGDDIDPNMVVCTIELVISVSVNFEAPEEEIREFFDDEWDGRAWRAMTKLFENPYFARMWAIQEVDRGANVEIHHGGRSLPWDSFSLVALQCIQARRRAMLYGPKPASLALKSRASDPRDKVFALSGLLDEKNFLPASLLDYSKPAAEVFLETSIILLEQERDPFALLGLAVIDKIHKHIAAAVGSSATEVTTNRVQIAWERSRWYLEAEKLLQFQESPYPYTGQHLREAFWRTVVVDRSNAHDPLLLTLKTAAKSAANSA